MTIFRRNIFANSTAFTRSTSREFVSQSIAIQCIIWIMQSNAKAMFTIYQLMD